MKLYILDLGKIEAPKAWIYALQGLERMAGAMIGYLIVHPKDGLFSERLSPAPCRGY